MIRLEPLAAALALTAAAHANLPPPADDYIGLKHVRLGGLAFEHRLDHYSRVIDHANNPSFVLLVGCEGPSHNCDAVTAAGVIDWEVVAVDGKPITGGDLRMVVDGFALGHGPVEVRFVRRESGQPPRTVTLKLERY